MPDEARLDGRYQLDDRVAAGGYGEVWRATDLVLGRPVAVKLLLAQHVQQAQTLARFRAEAQRTGSLCHENITRVYDYVEPAPPDPPFLVMELVDGPSAAQGSGTRHPSRPFSAPPDRQKTGSSRRSPGMSATSCRPSSSPWYR